MRSPLTSRRARPRRCEAEPGPGRRIPIAHPIYRPRRLRESPLMRRMVRETRLGVENLILPLFTVHGRGVREPVESMPGVSRLSLDELLKAGKDAASMGIPGGVLVGVSGAQD